MEMSQSKKYLPKYSASKSARTSVAGSLMPRSETASTSSCLYELEPRLSIYGASWWLILILFAGADHGGCLRVKIANEPAW